MELAESAIHSATPESFPSDTEGDNPQQLKESPKPTRPTAIGYRSPTGIKHLNPHISHLSHLSVCLPVHGSRTAIRACARSEMKAKSRVMHPISFPCFVFLRLWISFKNPGNSTAECEENIDPKREPRYERRLWYHPR
jgi:hypothetical protein